MALRRVFQLQNLTAHDVLTALITMAAPPPTLSFDRSDRAGRNLRSLQRNDPAVQEVLAMSGYAVVYRFSVQTRAWEREDTEASHWPASALHFQIGRSKPPRLPAAMHYRKLTARLESAKYAGRPLCRSQVCGSPLPARGDQPPVL